MYDVMVYLTSVVYHPIPTSNHNYFVASRGTTPVVYHPIPTSNHNREARRQKGFLVVYHPIPTSNHNRRQLAAYRSKVVYHPIPTSNHNRDGAAGEEPTVVYHPIPTSNHNLMAEGHTDIVLYIILFLHQTTTFRLRHSLPPSCISSYSYIKPQPCPGWPCSI